MTVNKVRIDLSDLCKLKQKQTWYRKSNGYIASDKSISGKKTHLYLHRAITKAPKGKVVDHINGNILDNRKANLRVVTPSVNLHNRHTSKHKYLGVFPLPNGSWNAKICGLSLGTYYTEKDAAIVVDEASRILYEEHARRQVQDATWDLTIRVFTTSKYGFKGVERNHIGKFGARYKRKSLGCFDTAEEAYAVWALRYWDALWLRVYTYKQNIKG